MPNFLLRSNPAIASQDLIERGLKISRGLNVTTIEKDYTVESVRSMLESLRADIGLLFGLEHYALKYF